MDVSQPELDEHPAQPGDTLDALRWIQGMRRYFLGFMLPHEFEAKLPTLTEESREYVRSIFESVFHDVITPEGADYTRILEPGRRRFFIDHFELTKAAGDDPLFRVKQVADHSRGTQKTQTVVDASVLEETGFVQYGAVLVGRTIQPLMIYDRNLVFTGMTEPMAVIIPAQTEEQFFYNFPFVRTFNHDGIQFSADLVRVKLDQKFIDALNLPVTHAMVVHGYKSSLQPTKRVSRQTVSPDFYRGVIAK